MLRYTISTLIVLVSLAVVVTVLAGVSHAEEAMDDPFAPYDALTPGQPTSALAAYLCHYVYIPPNIAENVAYCQIHPESGPILLVGVTVIDNTIQGLTFSVQGLQAGHLAQRWGHPDVVRDGKGFSILSWTEGISATTQTWGWFTYQSSIELVLLSSKDDNTTLS